MTYNYIKFEESEQDYKGGIRCNCGKNKLKYLYKFYFYISIYLSGEL